MPEPFQPVDNTARVILSGSIIGQPWANQMYFEHPTGWSVLTLNDLVTDVANWWVGQMKPLCHTGMFLTRVEATDLTSQNSFQAEANLIEAGTRSGQPAPNHVVLVVNFFTGVNGRAFKGRNFVGGAVEGDFEGNGFISGFYEDVITAYQLMPGLISVTGVDHVHVAFNNNGVRLAEGIPVDVIDYRTNGAVRPMKRRLPD